MTLRYDRTAHPCAIADQMSILVQGKLWHDGVNWHSKGPSGKWVSGRNGNHILTLMRESRRLPDTPYWSRVRRMTGNVSSSYPILAILRDASWHRILLRPTDLDMPFELEYEDRDCLCYGTCQYPPIPDNAY